MDARVNEYLFAPSARRMGSKKNLAPIAILILHSAGTTKKI
jgi:hypothetical protein